MPTEKDENPEGLMQFIPADRAKQILEQDRLLRAQSEKKTPQPVESHTIRVIDRHLFHTRMTEGINSRILKPDLVVYLSGEPERYFEHLEIIGCAGQLMQAMGYTYPASSLGQRK